MNLVNDLLDQGKVKDAVAFRDYFRESGLDCGKACLEFGKLLHGAGSSKAAALHYRRVLLLDPANSEAAAKLKELGEEKKNGGDR